ncbi:SIR2 family protein [Marispirochaeta aestuarii]|uniref:SIR2 family NAD-dependent protein deacylase n=1 Tax=Marispirochaeta aestuarii TaxID=1963862 RepID=UPI0029C94B50|nr:SIR2 family protein [Marispirochaeta aestuarii]
MSNQWIGLASAVQKFKEAVKDEIDKVNEAFHAELNGDAALRIFGWGPELEERNEYRIELSDLLFWHDPTAYFDELERWKGFKITDQHRNIRQILEEKDQTNVFNNFVSALRRKRVAPFIGAGLSKPCKYPLWGEAIRKLTRKLEGVSTSEVRAAKPPLPAIEGIREALDNSNFLLAAQLLYENHKAQIENFIRNTFDGASTRDMKGAILLIPQLTDGCIITTNFDALIEKVFHDENRAIEGYMYGTQTQNQFAAKLIQGERCILKLHGNFNSPATYIFSQVQYDAAYGKNELDYTKPLAKVLRQIFISHSLLFLGCSLEQDRTLELFINVVNSNSFDIPEHFAFLPEPMDHTLKIDKENLLSTAKIRPIWYKVICNEDGNPDHSELEDMLKFAIDCAANRAKV